VSLSITFDIKFYQSPSGRI